MSDIDWQIPECLETSLKERLIAVISRVNKRDFSNEATYPAYDEQVAHAIAEELNLT